MRKKLFPAFATLCLLASNLVSAEPSARIYDLRVNSCTEPLAVEDTHPLFSWKMESSVQGQQQQAYRIVIERESDGSTVWDSGEVASRESVGIEYQGVALQSGFGYKFKLSVQDKDGDWHEGSSRFEMGLMNSKISAWKGAKWTGSKAKWLDAASEFIFSISADFQIARGSVAGFLLGGDDFRLKNTFYNDFNLAGGSYLKVILDFKEFGKPKGAEIRVYRCGYAPWDKADEPVVTINSEIYPQTNLNDIIEQTGRNGIHKLKVYVENGAMAFVIDGKKLTIEPQAEAQSGGSSFSVGNMESTMTGASRFKVTPLAAAIHDFNVFPHLCSVGFVAEPHTKVEYWNYEIRNEGQSQDDPVFSGEELCDRFDVLEHVRSRGCLITVVNQERKEMFEFIDPSFGGTKTIRTEFKTSEGKTVAKAKLYASAMGVYNFFINGEKVGEDWFAPGDSQYRETITYQAYDVTKLLREGVNAMGAELFQGWFTGYMTFTTGNRNFFGDTQALLCRLDITYTDGTSETIVSDPLKWKVTDRGPVVAGSFFQGERYNACREAFMEGWCLPGYDESIWEQADEIQMRSWCDPDIVARYDQLVRVREVITAVREMPVHSEDLHTYIYDMGVNMVGVPEITFPQGWLQRGDTVVIRCAEQLYPGLEGDSQEYVERFGPSGRNIAGHMLYETNRAALDTDFYIAASSDQAVYRPRSTYRGYQYIQITIPSHQGPLPLENIKGVVLSSCEIPTGTYKAVTANPETATLVNQLFRNTQRSQLGNFFTIPTDCPQRNERMGWTGDAQAYSRTATYHADVQNFFRQWMVALRADQGVGNTSDVPGGIGSTVPTYNKYDAENFADGTTWAAAVCMVPWQIFSQYGDTRIVRENIETMMNWLNGMAFYKWSDEYPYLSSKTSGLSDWLALDGSTPPDLVNNAVYIYMMEATAIMADAIGRHDYAEILKNRRELAIRDWNKAYIDPQTKRTRAMDGTIIHSQTSYATPLNFNVFNEENKTIAESYLAQLAEDPGKSGPKWTITTGFSGTPNILPALSRGGYTEQAYRMFTCTALPSWLYPVTKGATSVWERWNSYDVAFAEHNANTMNSFNHFALGAVGQWMYEFQLGITNDHRSGEAGYSHFILQPSAGADYLSLDGSFESSYGRIASSWTADGKGKMTSYKAVVPANTDATLYLPVCESSAVFQSSEFAVFKGTIKHNGLLCAEYELSSGNYSFSISETGVAQVNY